MERETKELVITPENTFFVLLCLVWSKDVLGTYTRVLITKIIGNNYFVGYVIMTIFVIILILASLKFTGQYISIGDFVFVFFCFSFFETNLLINKDISYYLNTISLDFIFICLPSFFAGVCVNEYYYNKLGIVSLISLIAFVLYVFTLGSSTLTNDNMLYAYSILQHSCLVMYMAFITREKKYIYGTVLGVLISIFMGVRGPMLLLGVFFCFCLYIYIKKQEADRINMIFFRISVIGVVFFWQWKNIMIGISEIALQLGMSTRVFEKLISGKFFMSEGRDTITDTIINAIKANPIKGYGIAGDRNIIGIYSHNILYEFWISYGVPIGSILLIILIIIFINALMKSSSNIVLGVYASLLFSSGFLKLFLSGSYLFEQPFYLLLGIAIGIIRKNKQSMFTDGA